MANFKNLKFVVKAILFFVLLTVLLRVLSYYFVREPRTTQDWKSFYELPRNSLDILFIGSSHSFFTFVPNLIDSHLKTNSFNLASESQIATQTYFNLVEVFKSQTPEIIVLESFVFRNVSIKDLNREAINWNMSGIKLSLNKINAVREQYPKNDIIDGLFPIFQYHNIWKTPELIKRNINEKESYKESKSYYLRGIRTENRTIDLKALNQIISKIKRDNEKAEPLLIPLNKIKLLHKIDSLCKVNNSKLLIVTSPYHPKWLKAQNYNYFFPWLESEIKKNNILSYDFNKLEKFDSIYSDRDFLDFGHVNYSGALKSSYLFSSYLKSQKEKIQLHNSTDNAERLKNGLFYYFFNQKKIPKNQIIGSNIKLVPSIEIETMFVHRDHLGQLQLNLILTKDCKIKDVLNYNFAIRSINNVSMEESKWDIGSNYYSNIGDKLIYSIPINPSADSYSISLQCYSLKTVEGNVLFNKYEGLKFETQMNFGGY